MGLFLSAATIAWGSASQESKICWWINATYSDHQGVSSLGMAGVPCIFSNALETANWALHHHSPAAQLISRRVVKIGLLMC